MQKDVGKPLSKINVDGGASANSFLMQFQSDILGTRLERPEFIETTSLGAVFAAGIGNKIWNNLSHIKRTWKLDRVFSPTISDQERTLSLNGWHQAVKKALSDPSR